VIDVPIIFFYKNRHYLKQKAMIDTIVLEPDEDQFSMTWRATIPLKRDLFELSQVLVGRKSKGWWRARKQGKAYYPSLAHLVRGESEKQA
jgi:hypothetical protein